MSMSSRGSRKRASSRQIAGREEPRGTLDGKKRKINQALNDEDLEVVYSQDAGPREVDITDMTSSSCEISNDEKLIKQEMIKETESDKEALEPDKIDEGECVSDREVILVLDSDEDEGTSDGQSNSKDGCDTKNLDNSVVILDLSLGGQYEEVWIDLTQHSDSADPSDTDDPVSDSSPSTSQLPVTNESVSNEVPSTNVSPDTNQSVSKTSPAPNQSTEKHPKSPHSKEPSESTEKTSRNEKLPQRKVEIVSNPGQLVGMSSKTNFVQRQGYNFPWRRNFLPESCGHALLPRQRGSHGFPHARQVPHGLPHARQVVPPGLHVPCRRSQRYVCSPYNDKVRVGITNGMPSSVFREITRHPSVLDLQHRKLIIFVDLDNWGGIFKRLASSLPRGVFVWGFYGGQNNWSPPSYSESFRSLLADRGFYLHPKCGIRKDAADFALCMQAGVIHAELPTSIPFVVLSGDKGFEELERQLKQGDRPREAHFINPHQMDPRRLSELLSRLVPSQR